MQHCEQLAYLELSLQRLEMVRLGLDDGRRTEPSAAPTATPASSSPSAASTALAPAAAAASAALGVAAHAQRPRPLAAAHRAGAPAAPHRDVREASAACVTPRGPGRSALRVRVKRRRAAERARTDGQAALGASRSRTLAASRTRFVLPPQCISGSCLSSRAATG